MTEASRWSDCSARPRDDAGLEVLSQAECLELAGSQPVGRVAFAQSGEIEVLPVNHRMVDGAVVFGTADGSKLGAAVQRAVVAFEVDAYDADRHEGWSVLVKGRMDEVTDEGMLARLQDLGLQPWRNLVPRPVWILVRPDEVSGRRLMTGDSTSDTGDRPDLPVEVYADAAVPPPVSAAAADLVRRLTSAVGRPVQYAAVILSVDRGPSGRRSSRIEATVQTVGLRVRGFAAGLTFDEALRDLDVVLRRRIEQGRERLRRSAGQD